MDKLHTKQKIYGNAMTDNLQQVMRQWSFSLPKSGLWMYSIWVFLACRLN